MAEQALTGLRVLDVSRDLPGAFCCKLLADLGAEVIKLEPPEGDPLRRRPPFAGDVPHTEKSALFLYLNTSKRSVTLNLEEPGGQALFRELARTANIVVETLPPGRMAALGLGYDALSADNPGLVLTSISPFGQTGPYRDYQATEIVSFASSGHMFISGKVGQYPLKYQGYKAGFISGAHAATATLGAVMSGIIHGEGQWVDVSIQETMLGPAEEATRLIRYAYLDGADEGVRVSARRLPGSVSGVFFCADGYVQISAANPGWWGRIALMMEMPELTDDPRFKVLADRRANWEDFEPMFYGWLADHTMLEITIAAQSNRIPAIPVYTVDQLVDDPQLLYRSYFVSLNHPAAGTALYPGAPFIMSDTPYSPSRAPLLGEHNEAILCGEQGHSRQELTSLRAAGII